MYLGIKYGEPIKSSHPTICPIRSVVSKHSAKTCLPLNRYFLKSQSIITKFMTKVNHKLYLWWFFSSPIVVFSSIIIVFKTVTIKSQSKFPVIFHSTWTSFKLFSNSTDSNWQIDHLLPFLTLKRENSYDIHNKRWKRREASRYKTQSC